MKEIDDLLKRKKPVVIAIDGISTSGKTTLAKRLENEYDSVVVFHMDDYYVPMKERTAENQEGVMMHVDFNRVESEVLTHVNQPIVTQVFDCKSQTFEEKIVSEHDIIVIEGTSSARKELKDYYDLIIFLAHDKHEQLKRIKEREANFIRFLEEWFPKEDAYMDAHKPWEYADVILRM